MEIKRPQHLADFRAILQPHRYLLCIDLEATCDEFPSGLSEIERKNHQLKVTRDEMETIEIGVSVLDMHDNFKQVGSFWRFVRPVLKPTLTPFCTRLTTITQHDVDTAGGYAEVRQQLEEYLAQYEQGGYMWCSWGGYDANQLEKDALRLGTQAMLGGIVHANAKKWHWKIHHCRAMGLQAAVVAHKLKWQGQCHRGVDDAANLGNLMRQILQHPSA